jgi:hypothetical protein
MLKVISNILIFSIFIAAVLMIGIFLWQVLFNGKEIAISSPKSSEEALVQYTKWLALFTAILALATIALFVSGERNVDVARKAADTASDALTANTRAWVAPSFMVLNTPVENGPPISFQIHLVNHGKEPALNVTWSHKYYLIPYIANGSNYKEELDPNSACDSLDIIEGSGAVIYPTGPTNFWLPLEIPDTPDNRKIVTAVVARQNSLVIDGCIAYRTAGKSHKSWFRFFLRDVPGQSFVEKDGNFVPNWMFNSMLTGNGAD